MQDTPIIRRLIDIIANGLQGMTTAAHAEPGLDPMQHPALKAMSARQLADLPFEPYILPPQAQASRRSDNAAETRPATKPGNACLSGACQL